jgi:NAD(P)-dependent dehydrogenase (short-subunit alcohol dehydrogenase family)
MRDPRSIPELVRLDGRVALVTGAAQGFGYACADRLSDAGASVLLTDVRDDRLEIATQRLAAEGRSVASAVGAVNDPGDVERLVADAVETFGRLDVLVNNAGVFREVLMEDSDEAFWDQTININLKGTFFASQAALPSLRQRRGNIVNVASESGMMGNPRCTVYCASKGGW